MQLAHLQKPTANAQPKLGPKSLRAITRPIVVRNGRQTSLDPLSVGFAGYDGTLPIPDPTGSWRTLEAQRRNLLSLPYTSLSTLALDLSPQINKGLWDFIRFGNPGFVIDDISEEATESSKNFLRGIGTYYGNFKNHFDSMWADIFVYGSIFTELVLGPGGRGGVDIALNNPLTGRFRYQTGGPRGERLEFGQETRRGFVSHDGNPLVRYIGFNRIGNNPYGRPLIAAGVHASLFLLGLISDLRRMVANQGVSHRDYSLNTEELLKLIVNNPEISGNDEATAQFINEHITQIQDTLANLDPEADYVHLSTVEVNYSNNSLHANMAGLGELVSTLKEDVVNGMKSVSALSNILNSTTETHITQQLEYFVASISSVQEEMSDMMSDYLTINNLTQGIPSEAAYRLKRQRTSDRREEVEIRKIETETVLSKVDAGIISDQEARDELDATRDELVVTG